MAASTGSVQKSQRLFNSVKTAFGQDAFDDSDISKQLAELKIIAREPKHAPSVYSKSGLESLGQAFKYAEEGKYPLSRIEAARVIANALLLQANLRQEFLEMGFISSLFDFYAVNDWDHEFVGARIIFLLTYATDADFSTPVNADRLLASLHEHLSKHAEALSTKSEMIQVESMALEETLKMLFNIVNQHPEFSHKLQTVVPVLYEIFQNFKVQNPPLKPPMPQIFNALAILISEPSATESSIVTWRDPAACADKLATLLQDSIRNYEPSQLEAQIVPFVAVIRSFYHMSAIQVQSVLRTRLLPVDEERKKPLGQSNSLASDLLKLQTSPAAPNLSEAISGLLYELSDSDATTFIKNIGYGHAAGYLMRHQIPIPEDLKQSMPADDSNNQTIPINPITGQRLDAEPSVDLPEMTEEEKEREAERLFVLFERLRATGAVTAENPVRKAMEDGRFEELPDSDPD